MRIHAGFLMRAALDPDLLRCFLAVTESGGFTAAGERIGLSQSAVSLKVKRLEELLDRRLLERTSRSLALTEEGELLRGFARRLLDMNEEAVRRLTAPPLEGRLRLGVAEYFGPQHLPGLLAGFRRAHPKVRLEVRIGMTSDLLALLDGGSLDLIFGKCDPGSRPGRVIVEEPLLWVGPAEDMAPCEPVPLLTLPPPCSYRAAAVDALDRIGRGWEIVFTSPSIMGVQAAVTAGFGVAVLGRAAVLPGMRVLGPAQGIPELAPVEVAVWGEDRAPAGLCAPLTTLLTEALTATGTR
jgi:DNA-binding transcriptional LysR family regulator